MAETPGNNFVAIEASNRLSLQQVKLLQQAVDNELMRYVDSDEHEILAALDQMGNDLMVVVSKMEAGE